MVGPSATDWQHSALLVRTSHQGGREGERVGRRQGQAKTLWERPLHVVLLSCNHVEACSPSALIALGPVTTVIASRVVVVVVGVLAAASLIVEVLILLNVIDARVVVSILVGVVRAASGPA
ncbi:hypothetical protein PG984_001734 [Apiospora sp. TS-2023a]